MSLIIVSYMLFCKINIPLGKYYIPQIGMLLTAYLTGNLRMLVYYVIARVATSILGLFVNVLISRNNLEMHAIR